MINPNYEVIGITAVSGNTSVQSFFYFLFYYFFLFVNLLTISSLNTAYSHFLPFSPIKDAARNAGVILNYFNKRDVPIFLGAEGPLNHTKEIGFWEGHGADGLGDALPRDEYIKPRNDKTAPQALLDLVNSRKGEITVLAVGIHLFFSHT